MSKIVKPSSVENVSAETDSPVAGNLLTSDALARRQMLLKSLGKGSVILAASVPIQTLANTTVLVTKNGTMASVSGMQSSVHSAATTGTLATGYSPGWWGQVDNNYLPNRRPRRSWSPVIYSALCTGTFTKTGSDDSGENFAGKTLFNVMDEPAFSNTKTRHWIGAYLNGSQGVTNFPYTGAQILAFYNLPASDANREAAYTLITNYLENL